MNHYLEMAKNIKEDLVSWRRYIHSNAELGFDLPKTIAFVESQLRSFGYEPISLGGGITCTAGNGSPVILLRADMDALPQDEESGLEFSCKTGACHSCGHDAHTTMLLGAAKLLKENERELKGTVKFVFQPAEELLQGSKSMIEAGVLDNPKADVAMALHLNFGPCGNHDMRAGVLAYNEHAAMASADEFHIKVAGKSAHGAFPELAKSALKTAANIVVELEQLVEKEISRDEIVALSCGQIHSGNTANIIPDNAEISGSIRTFSNETRLYIKKRLEEISNQIANEQGTSVQIEYPVSVPPTVNNIELTKEMVGYCEEVMDKVQKMEPVRASEDYANISISIPSFYATISAGDVRDGYEYAMHNPKARIDENALPYGAAVFCNCATKWLENHSK